MSARIHSVAVDQAAATTADIVAAVSGKQIEVLGWELTVENGALGVNSTLQDKTANTVRMTFTSEAATSVVRYFCMTPDPNQGLFTVAVGDALELVTGTAAVIAGILLYRYIDPR